MSQFGYSRQYVLLDGTSANSSVRTSFPILVADAQQISISYTTSNGSTANLLVQGSNDNGLSAGGSSLSTAVTAPFWSTISTVAAAGIFTVSAGARWIRVIRAATDSQSSVEASLRMW